MKRQAYLLLVLPFMFFSCASSYTKNKKIVVKHASDEKVELTASSSGVKILEEGGTFAVSNKEHSYIITTIKDNCVSSSKIITRKKFNTPKLLDILLPLACNVAMFTLKPNTLAPIAESAIVITGIGGWFWALKGPWQVYNKNYDAPAPTLSYPQKKPEQSFISGIDINVNVPKEGFTSYSYKDFDEYISKNVKPTKQERQIATDTISLTREELTLLDKFKLRDTSNTIFASKLTDLKLVFNVKTLEENLVLGAKQIQSKTEVSLLNNFSNTPIISREMEGSSLWRRNIVLHGAFSAQHQKDLVENVLAQFLNDQEVQQTLSNYKATMVEKEGEKFEYLAIKPIAENVKSISEAVKAVVTIVTKDGHGSGCIVSNDGYIITNSHVIANNDTNITVLFSDSSHLKAKLIAANISDDLALIKIDTALTYGFDVNEEKLIEIGTEVYGIGAYNLDDYTVSISKGIVSSIRKVDGKEFIQTDVTINGGNSGGALINTKGQLLGIITAKMVGKGIEGIGFVIPYHKIKESLKIKFE
ncbi:MAG: trypsin-like serine protease [Flavobacteriales bacterium]|nr:MAG: trypsin-like serine protease [Flavobacteriales bacterium]MBE7441479.1 trypsin-like peptidase domain-containing protein [Flavobacteriales bacterium]MCL4855945.1 trypsin-like peptidase domain-containing protein [Flavobacteriales bacterium]